MNSVSAGMEFIRVLVVEDDPIVREAARLALTRANMDVVCAIDCWSALEVLRGEQIDAVLLDMNLSLGSRDGRDGLQCLDTFRAEYLQVPVIAMTGYAGVAIAVSAMRAGAIDFLIKPWRNDQLIAIITRAVEAMATRPALKANLPNDLNLERGECGLIEAALERSCHNISAAARELGLTRAALYRRMDKYGL